MFMAPEVPTVLSENDFDFILNTISEDNDDKKIFIKCYEKINGILYIKKNISDQERWKLVEIYINSGLLTIHIDHMIIAHYFYSHGLSCGRKGNEYDDYYKSLYLCSLFPYLREKKTRCVVIENSEQMSELLCMVNNIYDRSFFLKKLFQKNQILNVLLNLKGISVKRNGLTAKHIMNTKNECMIIPRVTKKQTMKKLKRNSDCKRLKKWHFINIRTG